MDKISKKIDSYMITLFLEVLVLVSMIFMSYQDAEQILLFIMLGITFFTVIVTYIGGIILGLISTSICVFLYSLYIFYNNLVFNIDINYISYIWMMGLVLITLTTGRLSNKIVNLQTTNEKLQSEYKELVTIDKTTGLGNIKHFYNHLDKEISRAKRHNTNLTLMVVKLPYYKDIKNIIGEAKCEKLLKDVGQVITNSTRDEDDRYFLNNDMLGIIMPDTDNEGALIVKNRIKDRINKLNLELNQDKYNVNIDTKIAIVQYEEKIINSIKFKELCEEELQYDV